MKASSVQSRDQKASFRVVHPNAAGMDIGSEFHYVALPVDRTQSVRRFGCTTPELNEMGAYLQLHNIDTIAMEATGSYWMSIVQVLENYDLEVVLVDPTSAKNYKGRKTDVVDCQWIQELHTFGLLKECHRVSDEIAPLRSYWRHRANLVQQTSRQVLLMQKAMIEMNLHLEKVLSDITGVTGMAIMRAIAAGERDPKQLASYRKAGVKASREAIEEGLTGDWREEHLLAFRQALVTYDLIHQQIAEVDVATARELTKLESKTPQPASEQVAKPTRPRKNQPKFDLKAELYRITGVDLTAIEGIESSTAFTCLVECGIDLSKFPSEKHFTSWLGLAPNHRITGGKIKSNRTRKNVNRAATALRLAAQSLHSSKSALGAFFRRIALRRGVPKAIVATARKIACMFYRTIRYGWQYVAVAQERYENQYRQHELNRLKTQAQRLGLALVTTATGEVI